MESRIKLKILGITYSPIQDGAYALVLKEEQGARRIPIVIGAPEAQSIALRMEHIVPMRPLTHDIFVSFAHGFGIQLREVYIHTYDDGIFSADLVFVQEDREVVIDARTSDAIAVAIRAKAPIYIAPHIVDEVGLTADELGLEEDEEEVTPLPLTLEELQQKLQEAIASEAYELAAQLQREIRQRQATTTTDNDLEK